VSNSICTSEEVAAALPSILTSKVKVSPVATVIDEGRMASVSGPADKALSPLLRDAIPSNSTKAIRSSRGSGLRMADPFQSARMINGR